MKKLERVNFLAFILRFNGYSSSFSRTNYNKVQSIEEDLPDNANSDIYSTSVGYNYTFLDKNLIATNLSYTRKRAKAEYNSNIGKGLNLSYTRLLPIGIFKVDKNVFNFDLI